MRSRRELAGLAIACLAAPGAVEAAGKKPRFEEYVSTTLDAIGVSMSTQATTLQRLQNDLAALSKELGTAESLLGNTRLLEALEQALAEIITSCRTDHA